MKTKEIFDNMGFTQYMGELEDTYKEVMDIINDLVDNGVNVTMKTLPKYLKMGESEFRTEIESMKNTLLKNLGGILLTERKRIERSYTDYANDMYPKIELLQRRVKFYNLHFCEQNEKVAIDEDRMEEQARKKFTSTFNMDAFELYWERVVKSLKGIQELHEWESKNFYGEGITNRMMVIDPWLEHWASLGSVNLRGTKGAAFILNPNKEYLEELCVKQFEIKKEE